MPVLTPTRRPLHQPVVDAVLAIEAAAADATLFPLVPVGLPRLLRILAEDAVSHTPVGLTSDQIEASTDYSQTKTRELLNSLPGFLAIYAPRTVTVARDRTDRPGHAYIYRLALASS